MIEGDETGRQAAAGVSDAAAAADSAPPSGADKGDQIARSLVDLSLALGGVALVAAGALILLGRTGFPPPRSTSAWAVGYFGVGAAFSIVVVHELWLWRNSLRTDLLANLVWLAAGAIIVAVLKFPVVGGESALWFLVAKLAVLIAVLVAFFLLRTRHQRQFDRTLLWGIVLLITATWWMYPWS